MLTEWKRTDDLAFLNEVSSVPLQQALRHLKARSRLLRQTGQLPALQVPPQSRQSAEYTRLGIPFPGRRTVLAKMT